MKTKKIYHPNTKNLSGTVTELDAPTKFGDKFESNAFGQKDWHENFEEAENDVLNILHGFYTGETQQQIAEDLHIARQERACN